MAGDGQDWQQAATLASGVVQTIGGANRNPFSGNTVAGWAALAPTVGRTVLAWTIRNTGVASMDIGLGQDTADVTLNPGDSWAPPFNGALHVRNQGGGGTATSYQAVAVEV